jgi:hypothetical protein
MAPRVVRYPGTRTTRRHLMATQKSSAPRAHPSTEDHEDTVEAHYSCLERPCACLEGWVFIGCVDGTARRGKRPTAAAVARIAASVVERQPG